MGNWRTIEQADTGLAQAIRACFAARKHATMATLRKDGSPRISGTEVEFSGDEVFLGSMPGAVKALDLRRDPRFALHSPTVDPPPNQPSAWPGEAKLAGHAVEVSMPPNPVGAHRFRLVLLEAVLTQVVGDQLEITSWHEGRGVKTCRRS